MRLYTRYKSLRERKGPPPGLYWLIFSLALSALAFVIWKTRGPAPAGNPELPPHAESTNRVPWRRPHPVVRTNSIGEPVVRKAVPAPSNPPAPTVLVEERASRPATPPPVNDFVPRPVENVFEAQIALARLGLSTGSIDGKAGPQTRAGIRAFQQIAGLPTNGNLDIETKTRLVLASPPLTNYMLTAEDLGRLQPMGTNWLLKSQQTRLEYESALEFVAEKYFCHPALVKALNSGVHWETITPQTGLVVPAVQPPTPNGRASFLRIQLGDKVLRVYDGYTNLIAHFPCSIAQRVEKRPVGELHVAVLAPNPNYVFDPENFPESPEAQQIGRKLVLPPGPNNPVGTAWIGLDKPGYGIHGTPRPEEVGRTESHGCFRLANWNAEYLLRLVTVGTPVYIEPK